MKLQNPGRGRFQQLGWSAMTRQEWLKKALESAPKLDLAAKNAIRSALPPVKAVAK